MEVGCSRAMLEGTIDARGVTVKAVDSRIVGQVKEASFMVSHPKRRDIQIEEGVDEIAVIVVYQQFALT
jgi:hypothetical protein